jgi:hypothetical protein
MHAIYARGNKKTEQKRLLEKGSTVGRDFGKGGAVEMVILLEARMSRRRAPLNNVLLEYVTKCCCIYIRRQGR